MFDTVKVPLVSEPGLLTSRSPLPSIRYSLYFATGKEFAAQVKITVVVTIGFMLDAVNVVVIGLSTKQAEIDIKASCSRIHIKMHIHINIQQTL